MSAVVEYEAAPDWLTVTTTTVAETHILRRVADWYLYKVPGAHSWRMREYCGRKNQYHDGSGGVAYGERDLGQQGILQAWGYVSLQVGLRLADRQLKATRVDLAVTVLFDKPQPAIGQRLKGLIQQAKRQSYTAVVPVSDAGGTLYVGSRNSDMFGRLYDKGAQLGGAVPPRVLWRYEVEYKRHSAEEAAHGVWYAQPNPDKRRTFILGNVEAFFNSHAIETPFTAMGASGFGLVRYASRVQSSARTVKWLTEQVNPAILDLCKRGKKSDVLRALGVAVVDGVPEFEAVEAMPDNQLALWPGLDIDTEK